jgi:HAD superfamily hydrolase (TIGR01549 family)
LKRAPQEINALIFDWDGTLMDSAPRGFRAFQKTFEDLGIAFGLETYEAIYSPNWYSMYEALGVPPTEWPRADALWLQHYGEEPARFVTGAEETLQTLQQRQYRLGVVSSGTCSRIFREIQELGLHSIFETILCNEEIICKKPHPEGLQKAMQAMNCQPAECAYIGDSPEDIQMSRNAGVFAVGVRSGYPTSRHLLSTNPDICLDTICQLLDYFQR